MNSIFDLTGKPNPPYEFAHPDTSNQDAATSKRILRKVQQHLLECAQLEMRPNSVSYISHDRRSRRIIIYDLDELVRRKDLFVVVFYGHRRDHAESNDNQFFTTDWQIAMNLMGTSGILCYASQQLTDGNWFNIVIFPDEQSKHDVKKDPKHHYASHVLAPQRFDWVRLHNASLPQGMTDIGQFNLSSTKYFEFDSNWFAHRTH
jgi:hypothetical protein